MVYQPEIERNYHIFYQLLAGASTADRQDVYHLESSPSKYNYLSGGGPSAITIPGVDDAHEFKETQKALSTVHVSADEQRQIFTILAALLHLGNVKIEQRGSAARAESTIASDDQALGWATTLLGLKKDEFRKWTTKKQLKTRGETLETPLTAPQALVVRDSVAKYIYSSMFDVSKAQIGKSRPHF